jgi:PilZ domain
MDFVREKRWRVQYPVQLFTEDEIVEGRTVDISLHGLRVATDSSIKRGAHVVVQVLMPEGGCPIDGVLYTVRWIDQGKIGLEAGEISVAQQRRLQDRLISQGQEPVIQSTNSGIPIEQSITSMAGAAAALWQLFFSGHHVASIPTNKFHSLHQSKP